MESKPLQAGPPAKRASIIRPLDVQNILSQGDTPSARPSPVEHVNSNGSHQSSPASSRPTSFHGRTMSAATGSQPSTRSNRFSLTFPILPPTNDQSPVRRSFSPSREDAPTRAEAVGLANGPSDGNFLTAIAAQERRVLELKEELQKAEADLESLKSQWAGHEAQKKQNDARKVAKLQPLTTALPASDNMDTNGANAWMQQEMERRKTMLSGTRMSQRTVFSGSRHTRTLSLLSPVQNGLPDPALSQPHRRDSLARQQRTGEETHARLVSPPPLSRASTTPDLALEIARKIDPSLDLTDRSIDKELLLRTGKKMAMDFKDGLWTFWEDLRQATVGEEATQTLQAQLRDQNLSQTQRTVRKGGSKSSLRASSRGSSSSKTSVDTKRAVPRTSSDRKSPTKQPDHPPLVEVEGLVWTLDSPHRGDATPHRKAAKHVKAPSVGASVASSDAWDAWDDSPKASRSSSATSGSASRPSPDTSTHQSSPVSAEDTPTGSKRTPIPWPAMSNFSPTNLRKTADNLVNELERGLSPPSSKERTE